MTKHRPPLVCQHLENISRAALERHQRTIRHYVRNRYGVYALYSKNKLYYVGLASSLQGRLSIHLRDRHAGSWDRFSVYLTIGDSHLRELESLILRVVKPKGNKQKGKFAKSEDLRRQLQRDFKAAQKLELASMFGKAGPHKKPTRSSRGGDGGRSPALADYVTKPFVLRARHKGQAIKARVRRDGTIRFDGKLYTSPSLAGAAAVKRPTCNGWTFWQYERAPGDWVHLTELRKR